MRICVTGTYGTTSLVHRLMYNEFSVIHKPTYLTHIYRADHYEVYDVPNQPHTRPVQCDMLILTCRTQSDVAPIAREWFGYHKKLIVALVNTTPEKARLCPDEHLVQVDNMSCEGISNILRLIRTYK